MSNFGGAGLGQKVHKPTPPERGSFPLDHDGECKSIMLAYLGCIKAHRGTNDDECRQLSKAYLSCRMDRNLMAPDSFRNLGFGEESDGRPSAAVTTPTTSSSSSTATSAQQPPSQPQPQQEKKPSHRS